MDMRQREVLLILFCFLLSSVAAQKLSPWVRQAVQKSHATRHRAAAQRQQLMTVFVQTTEGADEVMQQHGA